MRLAPGHRDSFPDPAQEEQAEEPLESRMNRSSSLNPLSDLRGANAPNPSRESNSLNPSNPSNESNPSNSLNPSNDFNPMSSSSDSNLPAEPLPSASSHPLGPKQPANSKEIRDLKDSMDSLDVSGHSDVMRRVETPPQRESGAHELPDGALPEINISEDDSEKKSDSFSSDESDSSRNTLQSPAEERDHRVEMLKIEIEEIKKNHENELNLLRAKLDQLLISYMAIEQSL